MNRRMDPRLIELAHELGLSRRELVHGFLPLRAEPVPPPKPKSTGYVRSLIRAAAERRGEAQERRNLAALPYDERARLLIWSFWVQANVESGVEIPESEMAAMMAASPADRQVLLAAAARAKARADARARRQARGSPQDSPERVYRP